MAVGTARTVIRAGRLIDGTGAPPQTDIALIVAGTKIASIEPWREELRAGATVFEYPVETVLPGLVDAHCHLSLLGAGLRYEEEIPHSNEFMAVTAVYNAQVMLKSGVTTLRDNGCRDSIMFGVRDAMDRGLLVGPRMLIAGRPVDDDRRPLLLVQRRGGRRRRDLDPDPQAGPGGRGPHQDHGQRRRHGRALTPGCPPIRLTSCGMAVEAAHHYGRLTTAHCRATQAIANAVEAGLDCIEHAEFNGPGDLIQHVAEGPNHQPAWDAEVAQRLADSGMFASLTLPGSGYAAFSQLRDKRDREGSAALTPEERTTLARGEAAQEGRSENVRRFLELGMLPRLVVSSDAGPFDIEFGKLWQGLEVAIAGGMSTMQAIQASTRVAAEACGVLDKVGTLEAGKEADVLVVEASPLDNIRNLRDVVAVFKAGERVVGA